VDPSKRRGRIYRAVCRFSITKPGLWISRNIAWKLDPYLMRLTRGRLSSTGPLASALLETRGARTGRMRRNATLYFHDGERITLVASKVGWPAHPAWYHNLLEHPEVTFGGIAFRAQIVEDEAARRRLWAMADLVFPPFAQYRVWAAEAGREIPIVQLHPR
jgi:deazaflavin-dependent oxidoreductase (nitroreductase family)